MVFIPLRFCWLAELWGWVCGSRTTSCPAAGMGAPWNHSTERKPGDRPSVVLANASSNRCVFKQIFDIIQEIQRGLCTCFCAKLVLYTQQWEYSREPRSQCLRITTPRAKPSLPDRHRALDWYTVPYSVPPPLHRPTAMGWVAQGFQHLQGCLCQFGWWRTEAHLYQGEGDFPFIVFPQDSQITQMSHSTKNSLKTKPSKWDNSAEHQTPWIPCT